MPPCVGGQAGEELRDFNGILTKPNTSQVGQGTHITHAAFCCTAEALGVHSMNCSGAFDSSAAVRSWLCCKWAAPPSVILAFVACLLKQAASTTTPAPKV